MRQLPIFPYRHQYSIFGVSELNFCVRDENRWDLTAIVTAMVYNRFPLVISCFVTQYHIYIENISHLSCFVKANLFGLAKFFFVKFPYQFSFSLFAKRSSPRPISIGQLNTLLHLHLRPINLVVFKGSYYLYDMGYLILRSVSRLDAFSVYLLRTSLPCRAAGATTGAQ